jgi:hypothetical protein
VDVAHIGLDQLGDRLDVVEVQPDGAGTDREVEVVREIEPLQSAPTRKRSYA